MSTPVNIKLNGESILDAIDSCTISMQEGQFCFSVSISFLDWQYWTQCDPELLIGQLCLQVVIGSDIYQFFLEKRDQTDEETFDVWGRSQHAILTIGDGFSSMISDTEETEHIWQGDESVMATEIIAEVLSGYVPEPGITINWSIEDFQMLPDSLSISGESPLEVIKTLAEAYGAAICPEIDGSLTITEYLTSSLDIIASYNDLDDIINVSDSYDPKSGIDAVVVYGYTDYNENINNDDTNSAGDDVYISATRLDSGELKPGDSHTVRVYWYHPLSEMIIAFPSDNCSCTESTFYGTEQITETVNLSWGVGSYSQPSKTGSYGNITGNTNTPFESQEVSYDVTYNDYTVIGKTAGEYKIKFYFANKSGETDYSFTVSNPSGNEIDENGEEIIDPETEEPEPAAPDPDDPSTGYASQLCDSLVLEKVTNSVKPGQYIYVNVYNPSDISIEAETSSGDSINLSKNEETKTMTESMLLNDVGYGELQYPVHSAFSVVNAIVGSVNAQWAVGSRFFLIIDNPNGSNNTTYKTSYREYKTKVPISYTAKTFKIYFYFENCEKKELEYTIDYSTGAVTPEDLSDYTTIPLYVYKDGTDIFLEGATVSVDLEGDGNLSVIGTTNANGMVIAENIKKGNHQIKIIKTGYIDSDKDDLANDTFTI